MIGLLNEIFFSKFSSSTAQVNSSDVMQFSDRCPPKCANDINPYSFHTWFMKRSLCQPFTDWLKRNDADNHFITCRIRRMGKVLFSQVSVCPHPGCAPVQVLSQVSGLRSFPGGTLGWDWGIPLAETGVPP